MIRPVQQLGLNPDGVHRFLYAKSQEGSLKMSPEAASLEYGITYGAFALLCEKLVSNRDLVAVRANRSKLKSFAVTRPDAWEDEPPYFGQSEATKRKYYRRLSPQEYSDAIDLYDQLYDALPEGDDDAETSADIAFIKNDIDRIRREGGAIW